MPTRILRLRLEGDGYYRTQWVDDQGCRHRKSFGTGHRRAAWAFAKFHEQWQIDPRIRNPNDNDKITVAEAWERFEEHAKAYYRHADGSLTGESRNLLDAFAFVKELYGDSLARDFGPKKLLTVREKMVSADLTINTINARVRRVRHVFKWLVQEEVIPAEVWHSLQAIQALRPGRTEARVNTPVGPVPEPYIRAVQDVVPNVVRAMIEVQLLTGARPGEICMMRPIDVTVGDGLWVYRPAQHKSIHVGKTRVIVLGPKAKEALEPFLARAVDAWCFSPREAMKERHDARKTHRHQRVEKPKTRRRLREHFVTTTYARAINRACKKAKVPHWSPGQLRHNAATAVREQFGLDAAQVVLGHARVDVTQVYAESNLDLAKAVMEKIG